ncbi:HMCN1-like protein [Mya arenaria]|uniref:HMCN1-like protein n=1 Tax=Mya arenaria TaxID=6604 RepID=A0ABY7FCV7_MYAAR|nr:HMCN1-like protein [Mya arenaria]
MPEQKSPSNTVDGGYTLWSSWVACSDTCGDGTKSRSRTCTNPEPRYGGLDCVGDSTDSTSCYDGPCPIDGGFTSWSTWGTCTMTCGGGTQSRSRTCTNPEPQYGGLDCDDVSTESQSCNDGPCPIDGGYALWSSWDACSVTCGDGIESRSRSCTSPEPQYGGMDCIGDSVESQPCNDGQCPIVGGYTLWSSWDACSATCDDGTQSRTRSCTNPEPQNGGLNCVGDSSESQSCNDGPCPVEGGYTVWSDWDACSVTCDDGTQSRSRTCTNPEPQYGGLDCVGDSTETQPCTDGPCPVDGGFTPWSSWNACSVTCDDGTQSRSRTCSNPEPQYGGLDCVGDSTESQSCNDGPFHGMDVQLRAVTAPSPGHVRVLTQNPNMAAWTVLEIPRTMNYDPHTVNGFWMAWETWGACSTTCNGGTRQRTRECIPPQHGGSGCSGHLSEFAVCSMVPCPAGEENEYDNNTYNYILSTADGQSGLPGARARFLVATGSFHVRALAATPRPSGEGVIVTASTSKHSHARSTYALWMVPGAPGLLGRPV